MLALFVDREGNPTGLHRTYLAPTGGGKAEIEPQRATLGKFTGSAVRLCPAARHLAIGEGLESTLAAAELLNLPAWAACSAGNLAAGLLLPDTVREITIASDNDEPGRDAAAAAARRWKAEGRIVRIATPDREGTDFNDLLIERKALSGG